MSFSEQRLVLVGWGSIARRVAELLSARRAAVRIVAVALRDDRQRDGLPEGAMQITSPDALADLGPDLVVEAASRESVAIWGIPALRLGSDFAPASTSALTDAGLIAELTACARQSGGQLLIPAGALAGIDALSAAGRLSLDRVRHEIIKPPAAWIGTLAETLCNLSDLDGPTTFFEGSASDTARAFPQNANAAMTTALAGLGPEATRIALVADPQALRNTHRITAEGDFGSLAVTVENRPLATNPKSSELTALSLVRLIENRATPIIV
jgi:aspartate dehydrogenase